MSPLTVSAFTFRLPLSMTVRLPDTEENRSEPLSDWASMSPETVLAWTLPVRPTRVVPPLTPRTWAAPVIPLTTAEAPITPTVSRVLAGTETETTTRRRRPLRLSHLRKPSQGRSS
jgi:hypothetical protein